MDVLTRNLLREAISRHETCLLGITKVHDQAEVLRRLQAMERETWAESALEKENPPFDYRQLLSHLDDLRAIEQRYAECGQDYLREIVAQRYFEVLGAVRDMDQLMALATHTHPDLRRLVIIRFQEALPEALAGMDKDAVPPWFIHLLRQPEVILNFLSEHSCKAVMKASKALLGE